MSVQFEIIPATAKQFHGQTLQRGVPDNAKGNSSTKKMPFSEITNREASDNFGLTSKRRRSASPDLGFKYLGKEDQSPLLSPSKAKLAKLHRQRTIAKNVFADATSGKVSPSEQLQQLRELNCKLIERIKGLEQPRGAAPSPDTTVESVDRAESIRKLEYRLQQAKAKLANKEGRLNSAIALNQETAERVAELEKDLQDAKAEALAQGMMRKQAEATHVASKEEIGKLRAVNERMIARIHTLEEYETKADIVTLESAHLQEAEAKVISLQQQLGDAERKLAEEQEKNNGEVTAKARALGQVATIERELELAKADLLAQVQQTNDAMIAEAAAKKQVEQLRQVNHMMITRIRTLEANEKASKLLRLKAEQAKASIAKAEKLEKDLLEAQQRLCTEQEKVAAEGVQRFQAQEMTQKLQKELASVRERINRKEGQCAKLEEQRRELEKSLSVSQTEILELRSTVEALNAKSLELESLQSKTARLEAELSKAKKENSAGKTVMGKMKDQLHKSKAETECAHLMVMQIMQELDELKQNFSCESSKHVEELRVVTSNCEILTQDRDAAMRKLQHTSSTASELRKEVESLKKQLKGVRRDLDKEHKRAKGLKIRNNEIAATLAQSEKMLMEAREETRRVAEEGSQKLAVAELHHQEELRWRVSAVEDKKVEVEQSLTIANANIKATSKTVAKLEKDILEKESIISAIEEERDGLKVRARSKAQAQLGLKKKLKEAEERHEKLLEQNVVLKNQAQELATAATATRTRFTAAINEARAQFNNVGTELRGQVQNATALANARLTEISELRSQVESKNRKQQQMEASMRTLTSEKDNLSALARARLGELGEMRIQLDSKSNALSLMERSMRDLTQQRDSLMQAVRASREAEGRTADEVLEARTLAEARKSELAQKVEEAKHLAMQIRELHKDVDAAKKGERHARTQLKHKSAELTSTKRAFAFENGVVASLEADVSQLEKALTGMEHRVHTLGLQNDAKDTEISKLTENVAVLETTKLEMKSTFDTERLDLMETIDKLRKDLQGKVDELQLMQDANLELSQQFQASERRADDANRNCDHLRYELERVKESKAALRKTKRDILKKAEKELKEALQRADAAEQAVLEANRKIKSSSSELGSAREDASLSWTYAQASIMIAVLSFVACLLKQC